MSCWASFASMVSVPVPLPCMKPFNASFRVMADRNLFFVMDKQTFHMTYTNPIPLHSPPTLVISTIVIHVGTIGMRPSWNYSFVKLTSLSRRCVSRSFSCVVSLNHPFICSYPIPDGTHSHPVSSPHTSTVISSPNGGMSIISSSCTSIGIAAPSGWRLLYRSSLRVGVCSVPSMLWGYVWNFSCWYHRCIVLHTSLI